MRVEKISSGYAVSRKNRPAKNVSYVNNVTFEKAQPVKKSGLISKFFSGIWDGWVKACDLIKDFPGGLY